MKILALDLGDKWVGSALSDGLGISCRPYKTVELDTLESFLQETLTNEMIGTVVVGYPKTMGTGGHSEQTEKTINLKNNLEAQFTTVAGRTITWILWDERLSSKRADHLKGSLHKTVEAKRRQHSVAASFILQSYLDYLSVQSSY